MKSSEPWAKTSLLPGAQATDSESIPGTSLTEADARSMTRTVVRADILWGTKRSSEPSGEMAPGRKPGLVESSAVGDPPATGSWNAEYWPPRRSPKNNDFPSVRRLSFAKLSQVSCVEPVICGGGRGERSHTTNAPAPAAISRASTAAESRAGVEIFAGFSACATAGRIDPLSGAMKRYPRRG